VFGKHPPQNFPFIQRASGHIGGSVGDFLVKLFPDNQNQHLALSLYTEGPAPHVKQATLMTQIVHKIFFIILLLVIFGRKDTNKTANVLASIYQKPYFLCRRPPPCSYDGYDSVFTPSNEC